MIKWILLPVLTLAAVAVVVALVGYFLPQGHIASRSARYQQPPETIFDVIADVASAAAWRPDVKHVEMLPPVDGRPRFREVSGSGAIVMEVQQAARPSLLVTRIADPDQPFGGTWTFELARDGTGTRLTITERGEVYNVLFRALGRFVFGYTSTMDSYLKALGAKFGEAVTPE